MKKKTKIENRVEEYKTSDWLIIVLISILLLYFFLSGIRINKTKKPFRGDILLAFILGIFITLSLDCINPINSSFFQGLAAFYGLTVTLYISLLVNMFDKHKADIDSVTNDDTNRNIITDAAERVFEKKHIFIKKIITYCLTLTLLSVILAITTVLPVAFEGLLSRKIQHIDFDIKSNFENLKTILSTVYKIFTFTLICFYVHLLFKVISSSFFFYTDAADKSIEKLKIKKNNQGREE